MLNVQLYPLQFPPVWLLDLHELGNVYPIVETEIFTFAVLGENQPTYLGQWRDSAQDKSQRNGCQERWPFANASPERVFICWQIRVVGVSG